MEEKTIKQREHYRVPMEARLFVEKKDGVTLAGMCTNISMGGMCVSLEDELIRDSTGLVRMLYQFDGGNIEFHSRYRVAWIGLDKPDVPVKFAGIRFVELDNQNRSVLTRIILTRLAELETRDQNGRPEALQA